MLGWFIYLSCSFWSLLSVRLIQWSSLCPVLYASAYSVPNPCYLPDVPLNCPKCLCSMRPLLHMPLPLSCSPFIPLSSLSLPFSLSLSLPLSLPLSLSPPLYASRDPVTCPLSTRNPPCRSNVPIAWSGAHTSSHAGHTV